jgi:hypothetical protein
MRGILKTRIFIAVASLLVSSFTACGRGAGPAPAQEGLPSALPHIDKTELLRLVKHGDIWNGEIAAQTALTGADAEAAADLWRTQSFSSVSPACHNPGYAIKFYDHDVLIVYATLCWECNNIEFLTPQLQNYVGFEGEGAKGQALLKFLKANLG